MSESQQPQQINVRMSPDLGYHYRDLFQVFVAPEEVVIEFGNIHRSTQGEAVIYDRLVLSVQSAIKLQQVLHRSIAEMQKQVEKAKETTQAQ